MKFFTNSKTQEKNKKSRKERSENRLAALGIDFNPNLPATIENESDKIRCSKEIRSKIVSLWEVVNIARGIKGSNRDESVDFLKDVQLWSSLSPIEQNFLVDNKSSEQDIIDLTWRTEVLKVLYWSINELPSLDDPVEDNTLVDLSDKVIGKYPSLEKFLNESNQRASKETLDEADFLYRLHWCSRGERRNKQGVPNHYNQSVIAERDFALRWITNPNLKWDEITLDT
ncbi:DUF4272 domain-containing protein [Crocinitomix catalasitica]|uniref:DUF4272 domain-containing protein n=1 Tax=Crocinitomix catalasitica TaxID=184607 RepID=UPI00048438A7|nr:DUF4272 domain-containing protein [Crocinitomix catalasitica]